MTKFQKISKLISEQIKNSPHSIDPAHSLNTLEWVLKIDPNASEELRIAALGHDIERAVHPRVKLQEGENYNQKKMRHALRSAEILSEMMKEVSYDTKIIDQVFELVKNHEIGGWEEVDILQDADSISFFDKATDFYCEKFGEKGYRDKSKFMFDRSSERAKAYIKDLPAYNKVFGDIN